MHVHACDWTGEGVCLPVPGCEVPVGSVGEPLLHFLHLWGCSVGGSGRATAIGELEWVVVGMEPTLR